MLQSIMAEKDKTMEFKETKKSKKQRKKEERAHNKSARKQFRKDHPIGWKVNNFIKNLIKKNK